MYVLETGRRPKVRPNQRMGSYPYSFPDIPDSPDFLVFILDDATSRYLHHIRRLVISIRFSSRYLHNIRLVISIISSRYLHNIRLVISVIIYWCN